MASGVAIIGAAGNIVQGIDQAENHHIIDGIYSGVKGLGTLGVIGAVTFGILPPEAILAWGHCGFCQM